MPGDEVEIVNSDSRRNRLREHVGWPVADAYPDRLPLGQPGLFAIGQVDPGRSIHLEIAIPAAGQGKLLRLAQVAERLVDESDQLRPILAYGNHRIGLALDDLGGDLEAEIAVFPTLEFNTH